MEACVVICRSTKPKGRKGRTLFIDAVRETRDADYASAIANDRFKIPDEAHWKDVRTASRDVGRALLNAFQAIEAANPERLRGVFGNAAWTDKAQMPDGKLKNLIVEAVIGLAPNLFYGRNAGERRRSDP